MVIEPETVQQRLEGVRRDIGRDPERRRIVGAAPFRRQERALEVEAEGLSAVGRGRRTPAAHPFRELDERRERRCDRRRQERGDAATQEGAGHPVERGGIAHRVVPAPTVDVDVDEPRRDRREVVLDRGLGDADDPPVLDADHAGHHPIVEDQPAAGLGHAHEPIVACSAPWIAAPIAPAWTPNSALTRWTASSEVIQTRRRISSRIGANRSSPAAATPPPMTTTSGETTVDHVGDPDPQIPADLGQSRLAPSRRPLRRGDCRLDGLGPARLGDPVGAGERLDAAVIAAAAQRPVGIDRLVPISPAVPSCPRRTRPSIAMTPPTPVPSVRPTIVAAPRPAPSRSSASPNARASLMRATGSPRAASTGAAIGRSAQSPGTFTRNRVLNTWGPVSPASTHYVLLTLKSDRRERRRHHWRQR